MDTKEVASLAAELKMLEEEKTNIESMLEIRISENFMHRNDGQTIQSRIAEKEQLKSVNEKTLYDANVKREAIEKEVAEKKDQLRRLEGATQLIQEDYAKAKETYQKTIGS